MRASRRMRWKRVISWFETRDVASLLTMRSVHRCYQAAQCRNRLCPCHAKPKAQDGGDRGIRTLDRALQPYNGLANRRLQPLGHISVALDMPDTMASRKRQMRAKSCSLRLLRVLPPNLRNGGDDPMASQRAGVLGRAPTAAEIRRNTVTNGRFVRLRVAAPTAAIPGPLDSIRADSSRLQPGCGADVP